MSVYYSLLKARPVVYLVVISAVFILTCSLSSSILAQEKSDEDKAVDTFDWRFLHQISYRSYDNPQPADNKLRVYTQPDGAQFMARFRGVESYNWHETAEGRVIRLNKATGFYEYVVLDSGGRYRFSGVLVGIDDPAAHGITPYIRESKEVIRQRVEKYLGPVRPAKAAPAVLVRPTGLVKQVVILARFHTVVEDPSALTPEFSQEDFDRLFNEEGCDLDGAQGSFRDYYQEVSYGSLDVQSTVADWIKLPEYDHYYSGSEEGIAPRYEEFAQDCIAVLDAAGFDFSNFDADGDGYVDAVSLIHQGQGGERGGGVCLWSKRHALHTPVVVDGVTVSQVTILPELESNGVFGLYSGKIEHIGVSVHEFGHMLGLDDLYDPVNKPDAYGVGYWCLMSNGNYLGDEKIPSHPLGFQKIQLGWVTPTVINRTTLGLTLREFSRYGDVIKVSRRMGRKEYFLLENRQQRDFDSDLPGHGLIVTHVDDDVVQNSDPTHYRVSVLQADGRQHLEGLGGFGSNQGDSGDPFPGTWERRQIGPSTNPSTDNYAGRNTNIYISNIREDSRTIVLDIGWRREPADSLWPGPDEFGYTGYLTSGGFVDISGDGTEVSFSDEEDGVETLIFPSDFKFYFYAQKTDAVRTAQLRQCKVSTNGWLAMGSLASDSMPTNRFMPYGDAPNFMIAPLWRDMRLDEPGRYVKYKLIGSKPNRTLIIQWNTDRQNEGLLSSNTVFQVKLHEEGDIEFCYDRVGIAAASATIGIQKNGLVGLCYSFLGKRELNNGDRIVFTKNIPPFGMLVTPSNGSGFGDIFSARFVDPDGVDDLSECYMLFNKSKKTTQGVYVMYNTKKNMIGLRNNADSGWITGTPGEKKKLSNDRANLKLADVEVNKKGNTLTLAVPLDFKETFEGTKNIYLKAKDKIGSESDWVTSWTYKVEAPKAPELIHVLPAGGAGSAQTFRFKYRDQNGHDDLRYLSMIICETLRTVNSVYIRYDVETRTVMIRDRNDTAWSSGVIGSSGTIQTLFAEIDLSGSAAIMNPADPYNIELVLPITFKKGYDGAKNIYMHAEDLGGLIADWQIMGTWTVN